MVVAPATNRDHRMWLVRGESVANNDCESYQAIG